MGDLYPFSTSHLLTLSPSSNNWNVSPQPTKNHRDSSSPGEASVWSPSPSPLLSPACPAEESLVSLPTPSGTLESSHSLCNEGNRLESAGIARGHTATTVAAGNYYGLCQAHEGMGGD